MHETERLSYRLVNVGDFAVGLAGLDETFATLRESGQEPEPALKRELLARTKVHNYISPASEEEYAEALLREFRAFCQREADGNSQAEYGTWQGHPRETIPWYPTIHPELCDGCGACLRFCSFGVLAPTENDKVGVVEPFRCQVGCSTCTQICVPGAISFPPRQLLDQFAR